SDFASVETTADLLGVLPGMFVIFLVAILVLMLGKGDRDGMLTGCALEHGFHLKLVRLRNRFTVT
uniref:hypothetical protein n=1 Tax=Cephaloticoccus sp. TaxID=1985742 RepID=UPI00404A2CCA